MIVDSSVIVSVARAEPGFERYLEAASAADQVTMSAGSYLESALVLDRHPDRSLSRRLDQLLDQWRVEIVPVTAEQARRARQAHRDFGRGSGSRARLNFGDCLTYALASEADEPLLFRGDDFTHTDLAARWTRWGEPRIGRTTVSR